MVLYGLGKSNMVFYGLCDLVRFFWLCVFYYANVFPCKVSNGLVWLCLVLYDLTQLCTIFVLVMTIGTRIWKKKLKMKMKTFFFQFHHVHGDLDFYLTVPLIFSISAFPKQLGYQHTICILDHFY